jgi:hypothetical protein
LIPSLVVFGKVLIPTVVTTCYPSEIFVQIMKITSNKYISYLTRITWVMKLKRLTQVVLWLAFLLSHNVNPILAIVVLNPNYTTCI